MQWLGLHCYAHYLLALWDEFSRGVRFWILLAYWAAHSKSPSGVIVYEILILI